MGLNETIAPALDDYISTAARLAHDTSWRASLKARIAENKQRIFRDRACISALEEFLDRAVRGAG